MNSVKGNFSRYHDKTNYDNESNLSKSNNFLEIPTEQISFFNYSNDCCTCFVDIVDSTKNTNKIINSDSIRDYYSLFLNTMSSIIKNHNGKVIKNSGDSLLYYFPRTVDSNDELAFQDVIECGLEMITINDRLNLDLKKYNLPPIRYRISANYGRVEIAISPSSNSADLFGSSVNICSKINHLALSNELIIHSDLHKIIKNKSFYKDYFFRKIWRSYQEEEVDNTNHVVYSVNYTVEDKDKQKVVKDKIKRKIIENQLEKQNLTNTSFNILIVDDDEDILFTFNSIIREEGYNVQCFSNPIKALDHLLNQDLYFYHLILMDIRMPELNGIKLYSKIKAINPDIKVLIISALNAIDEVLSIFPEIKYSEIIRKPVEPDILVSKIGTILRY